MGETMSEASELFYVGLHRIFVCLLYIQNKNDMTYFARLCLLTVEFLESNRRRGEREGN